MRKTHEFQNPGMANPIKLDIEKFSSEEYACIIISERKDNPGQSVTNGAEAIIAHLLELYGSEPEKTMFIEHYDHNSYASPNEETYSRIVYTITEDEHVHVTGWQSISLAAIDLYTHFKIATFDMGFENTSK